MKLKIKEKVKTETEKKYKYNVIHEVTFFCFFSLFILCILLDLIGRSPFSFDNLTDKCLICFSG